MKKLFKNFNNFFHPLPMSGMGSRIFFRTSLVPSITYILAIKICLAVFERMWFFDFSKFVYNFCKNFFFKLILGVNLFCSGSHLSLQYGSNPGGGTQTMLILLRPFRNRTAWKINKFFKSFNSVSNRNSKNQQSKSFSNELPLKPAHPIFHSNYLFIYYFELKMNV